LLSLDNRWGISGDWTGINAWQRFVIADALIDYERRSGDESFRPVVAEVVVNRHGLDGNDDDLWAVIAEVHDSAITHNSAELAQASSDFDRIVRDYWDDQCGGGLWWDHARTYKNAITNELLIYAATQIYESTRDDRYRNWAVKGWNWFKVSGMIGTSGLVNDGLDLQCKNNGRPTFTYNQGVLIGGLDALTIATGDDIYRLTALKLAIASETRLSLRTGTLAEPTRLLNTDELIFKGIFAYHLGHLIDHMAEGRDRSNLLHWVRHNGDGLLKTGGSERSLFDGYWDGSRGNYGAASQTSAVDLLLAGSGVTVESGQR
jgi:predicted alpha-1,6-mannanase (GH76 family)